MSKKLGRPSLLQLRGKKKLVGAEIGVQRGTNAHNILKTLHIKKLYLIDPYRAYTEKREIKAFMAGRWMAEAVGKLRKWETKIVWIRKKSGAASKDIPDNTLDFVYIDGSHLYEDVVKDIKLYTPKVKMGGLIAGHDYNLRGVKAAVHEMFGDKITTDVCISEVRVKRGVKDWWVWKNE